MDTTGLAAGFELCANIKEGNNKPAELHADTCNDATYGQDRFSDNDQNCR